MKIVSRLLFIICTITVSFTTFAQDINLGDKYYNEALAKMEVRTQTSIQEAIKILEKAKVVYESQSNKLKCDSKIKECRSVLSEIKARKVESKPEISAATVVEKEEAVFKFKFPELVMPSQSCDTEMPVITNVPGNWLIENNYPDWVKVTPGLNGIKIQTEENPTRQDRDCRIIVSSGPERNAVLELKQLGTITYRVEGQDEADKVLKFKTSPKAKDKILVYQIEARNFADWKILRDSTDQWIIIMDETTNSFSVKVPKLEKRDGKERVGRICLNYLYTYQENGDVKEVNNNAYVYIYQGDNKNPFVSGVKKAWNWVSNPFRKKHSDQENSSAKK